MKGLLKLAGFRSDPRDSVGKQTLLQEASWGRGGERVTARPEAFRKLQGEKPMGGTLREGTACSHWKSIHRKEIKTPE